MKIALVYTNSEANVGRGAGYVAGALSAAGHTVTFLDTFIHSPERVVQRVVESRCELLMVSSMTLLFPQALKIIRQIKARRALPVVVGGVHATIMGGELLARHPEIDFACVGEGESMAPEFAARFGTDGLCGVDNLAWRRNGRVHVNRLRPPEDLATLPPFPWYLFAHSSIVQRGQGFMYVTATRGCPYNCSYCCNGIYLKHYGRGYLRFRPIDQVVGELTELTRVHRPRMLYFADEMILSDGDYARRLFDAVHRRIGLPYGCMLRVEHATAANARMLRRTGCRYVGMGIECGDEAFRRRFLNRKMSDRQLVLGFRRLQAQGIFTSAFNMIGYPVPEDEALSAATERLNRRIRPDYVQISIFYPFPGTRLHTHCTANDLIDPQRVARQRRYYDESVLRGRRVGELRRQILRRLNPHGFRLHLDATPGPAGLRRALTPRSAPALPPAVGPGPRQATGAVPVADKKPPRIATPPAAAAHHRRRPKLALFCPTGDHFMGDIAAHLSGHYEIRRFRDRDADRLDAMLRWCDVAWFEWCDETLLRATRRPKVCRIVCRLHSYEAFTPVPARVNWERVDALVFVAPHIRDIVAAKVPGLRQRVRTEIVPNGVDLRRFTFRSRPAGHALAYVGYLNHKKNPSLLLQCLRALVDVDPRYRLHVAGEHQELRFKLYMEQLIGEMGLSQHIRFHGWVADVSGWLADKHFIVSTSVLESFGYGIAEAMACGLKPVVHNFFGARRVYPAQYLFNTVAEFVAEVTRGSYRPREYRDFIAGSYSLDRQLGRIGALLETI